MGDMFLFFLIVAIAVVALLAFIAVHVWEFIQAKRWSRPDEIIVWDQCDECGGRFDSEALIPMENFQKKISGDFCPQCSQILVVSKTGWIIPTGTYPYDSVSDIQGGEHWG